jgi:hypothetical protein
MFAETATIKQDKSVTVARSFGRVLLQPKDHMSDIAVPETRWGLECLTMDPKSYLDYLDKEMTIMGILSAFSVAAPAGVLVTVMGKDGQVAALWNSASLFVIAGSVFCVLAASLFYKERSNLAWFYGQISLVQARGGDETKLATQLADWFRDADAWSTWLPYFCGFILLLTGFTEYLLAIIFFAAPPHWKWLAVRIHDVKVVTFFLCPVIAAFACILESYVRIRYEYEDDAWLEFRRALTRRK